MMKSTDIFTEYNSNLINQIDRDPLGFQQIWTHFGQKIFNSKTTSVATDIRNYTINLVHHNIIRQLPDKATSYWNLVSKRNYKEGIEKSIILLEMMLAHSRVISGTEWKESRGILGTSMAFKRWQENEDSVYLDADLSDPSWERENKKSFEMLLVRQVSLGINGRYKGPFMRMGFFESDYKYSNYSEQWDSINIYIENNPVLKQLQESIFKSLQEVTKEVSFNASSLWCEAYENAFNQHEITSKFSREFWPQHLGFRSGAAKAIFELLIEKEKPCDSGISGQYIFREAIKRINIAEIEEVNNIQDILNVEPILVKLDATFKILIKTQNTKIDVSNVMTVIDAYNIPSGVPQRLIDLIKLIKEERDVIKALLTYHNDVMDERGNMPWIRVLDNGELKVYLHGERTGSLEDLEKQLKLDNDDWIHPYYIPSMEEIVCGMTKGDV